MRIIAFGVFAAALLSACAPADPGELEGGNSIVVDGLRYVAETALIDTAPTKLRTVVTLTNERDTPVHLEFGACSLRIDGFADSARKGEPVWNSRPGRDPITGIGRGCPEYLAVRDLAPGESISPREFQQTVPVYEIIGHPLVDRFLPDGAYYFTAELRIINHHTVAIPAGQADLTIDQDPLPSSRTVKGIVYSAETVILDEESQTVRTTLTVTNNTDRPITAPGIQGCPMTVYAYRGRDQRDAAYVSKDLAWWPTRRCVHDQPELELAPGESRQFEMRVTGRELLSRSSDQEGRFYFVVLVWEPYFFLEAGEAQVSR